MAKLATVKLRHRTNGKKRIVNAFDYARDIAKWRDWRIITQQRGDADVGTEHLAKIESNIDKARKTVPSEVHKRGDRQRAYDQRKVEITTDWRSKPWFARRKYVGEVTGTVPKNAEEAETLMEAHGRR